MHSLSLPDLSAPFAADLCAFCDAVQATVAGLDYSHRNPATDLLSLYALGALGQMLSEGLITDDESLHLATLLLVKKFHWNEDEAWVRAESLFEARNAGHGVVRLVLERGGSAFDSWRSAPQFFTSFGLAELIERTHSSAQAA